MLDFARDLQPSQNGHVPEENGASGKLTLIEYTPTGSWKLESSPADRGPNGLDGQVEGAVDFTGDYARFSGDGHIRIPATDLFRGDFTISLQVRLHEPDPSPIGDVFGLVDKNGRGSVNLGFHDGTSTSNKRNCRNLFFGVDHGSEPELRDHGRPGYALFVPSLASCAGSLFAGTFEGEPHHLGRVFRLEDQGWVDTGLPSKANAVTALASHGGSLFAGTTRYRAGGSGLDDSPNDEPGGAVYRLDTHTQTWESCGNLGDADSVTGFAVVNGTLFAAPSYSEGLFQYDGGGSWTRHPGPGRRLLALSSHRGKLYGAGNDHQNVDDAIDKTRRGVVVEAIEESAGGGVFEFSPHDHQWESLGLQPDTTQVYSIGVHGGQMHISTWPTGLVFRRSADGVWDNLGRLGQEQEVMGLVSYNGLIYAGTVPSAAVFRLVGNQWERVAVLEEPTDVLYPRAASMAVFDGSLFCGTSPSGRVWALTSGLAISNDVEFDRGWHHVAAVRAGNRLLLYLDGKLVGSREGSDALEIGGEMALIGSGAQSRFTGDIAGVDVFDRALTTVEVAETARSGRPAT